MHVEGWSFLGGCHPTRRQEIPHNIFKELCNMRCNLWVEKKEKEMTDKEKLMAGYRMWKWLAENPECEKGDWPEWKGSLDSPNPEYCFACQIAKQDCDKCPLGWDSCSASDYLRWYKSTGTIRSHYAAIIAELHKQAADKIVEKEKIFRLPLHISAKEPNEWTTIQDTNGSTVFLIGGRHTSESGKEKYDLDACTEFILKACNNYHEMLEHIKTRTECHEHFQCKGCRLKSEDDYGMAGCINDAKRIYAKLTGKK